MSKPLDEGQDTMGNKSPKGSEQARNTETNQSEQRSGKEKASHCDEASGWQKEVIPVRFSGAPAPLNLLVVRSLGFRLFFNPQPLELSQWLNGKFCRMRYASVVASTEAFRNDRRRLGLLP